MICTYRFLILISIRILALPFPGVCTHLADSVLCFPAKFSLSFGCIGVAGCDVSRAACFDHVWDLNTCSCLEVLNNVENAVAFTCSKVVNA